MLVRVLTWSQDIDELRALPKQALQLPEDDAFRHCHSPRRTYRQIIVRPIHRSDQAIVSGY
jgi:hypothetical protein